MIIDKNYLVLPITRRATCKKVKFTENGKLIFDLDVALDLYQPYAYAYYDIRRFRGRDLEIVTDPVVGYTPVFADEPDESRVYTEKYRPQFHFAPKFGWLNDPNGLIKVGDTYHLFFQYNPCNWTWGNMHWGHAISKDLFHWKQLDIALFPDEMGMMYSGSAIADVNNVSGLGDGKNTPILFYYTAASNTLISEDKAYTQCLAYSLDGGMTLKKYEQNPIIPHIVGGNRDPKVVWCKPLGKYLMSLFLDGEDYTLFSSSDLIHWDRFQDIHIQEESECPDMFPITADDGAEKWCIYGASSHYLIGEFKDGKFVPEQPVKMFRQYFPNYAGQSYSGLEGNRKILVLWQCLDLGTDPLCGQMSVPMDMTLKKTSEGYLLCTQPVEEIKKLWKNTRSVKAVDDKPISEKLGTAGLDVTVKFPYVAGKRFAIHAYGLTFTVDLNSNEIWMFDRHIPVSLAKSGECDVRILIDRCTAEIFTDGGINLMATECMQDLNLPTLTVDGDVKDINLVISEIPSVWGE